MAKFPGWTNGDLALIRTSSRKGWSEPTLAEFNNFWEDDDDFTGTIYFSFFGVEWTERFEDVEVISRVKVVPVD